MKQIILLSLIIFFLFTLGCSEEDDDMGKNGTHIAYMTTDHLGTTTSNFFYDSTGRVYKNSGIKPDSRGQTINYEKNISYNENNKVERVNNRRFVYKNDRLVKIVSDQDTTKVYNKYYYKNGDISEERIYQYAKYSYEDNDTIRKMYYYDEAGNVKRMEKKDINNNLYDIWEFKYDDKKSKYWNLPHELKVFWGFNPGMNNRIKLDSWINTDWGEVNIIHKNRIKYNKYNLPVKIIGDCFNSSLAPPPFLEVDSDTSFMEGFFKQEIEYFKK